MWQITTTRNQGIPIPQRHRVLQLITGQAQGAHVIRIIREDQGSWGHCLLQESVRPDTHGPRVQDQVEATVLQIMQNKEADIRTP